MLEGGVGFCEYLYISDLDEDSFGTLFDQLKECGVNNEEEE